MLKQIIYRAAAIFIALVIIGFLGKHISFHPQTAIAKCISKSVANGIDGVLRTTISFQLQDGSTTTFFESPNGEFFNMQIGSNYEIDVSEFNWK